MDNAFGMPSRCCEIPIDTDFPSPAQLLQGRSHYDGITIKQHCLFPRAYDWKDIHTKFINKQENMKMQHDGKTFSEKTDFWC